MKIFDLPNGYKETLKIDLQKNIKLAIIVNVLSLVIAAIVFFIGVLIKPINLSFGSFDELMGFYKSFGIIFVLMVVYLVLHELVHGIFFKKYSGQKAKYGFTGLYAFAKSEAYYNKKEFLVIGLSPIVIWGVILLILNFVLSFNLFWYVFAVQIINLSGAAGDLYVAFALRKMPDDILVKDFGVSMQVYEKI